MQDNSIEWECLDLMQELDIAGFPNAHSVALAYIDYTTTLHYITTGDYYVSTELRSMRQNCKGLSQSLSSSLPASVAQRYAKCFPASPTRQTPQTAGTEIQVATQAVELYYLW